MHVHDGLTRQKYDRARRSLSRRGCAPRTYIRMLYFRQQIEIDALVFFLLSHGTSITNIYAQTRSSVETRAQEIRPENNTESLALTAKIIMKKKTRPRELYIHRGGFFFFVAISGAIFRIFVKLEANQVNPHPWTKNQ